MARVTYVSADQKSVSMSRFTKNLVITLFAAVMLVSVLTACDGTGVPEEIDITITFMNSTDYKITGVAFQIYKGHSMNNPMRGPNDFDTLLLPGESTEVTFNIPKRNLDGEWTSRLRIDGEENYYQDDFNSICFDEVKLIEITCDDEKNFRFTPYLDDSLISNPGGKNSDDIGSGFDDSDDIGSGFDDSDDIGSGFDDSDDVGGGFDDSDDIGGGFDDSDDVGGGFDDSDDVSGGDIDGVYQFDDRYDLDVYQGWWKFDGEGEAPFTYFEVTLLGDVYVYDENGELLDCGSFFSDKQYALYGWPPLTVELDNLGKLEGSPYRTDDGSHIDSYIYFSNDNGFGADYILIVQPDFADKNAGVRGDDDYPISEDKAMDLLADAIGGMPDGTAIVSHYDGVDVVYGEDFTTFIYAYIFAYGANHEENFVAESFYAVDANDGTVYVYDMVKGVFTRN